MHNTNRRNFCKQVGLGLAALTFNGCRSNMTPAEYTRTPDIVPAAFEPLSPDDSTRLCEQPVNSITPRGWLYDFLHSQRTGLTGHLEVADYPFNTKGWAAPCLTDTPDQNTWASYEQYSYWLDGMLKCGYLLRDDRLLAKAREQIYYPIEHAGPNGFIGPRQVSYMRWPQVVFFRSLMAEYEAAGDEKIIQAMQAHYLNDMHNLKGDYQRHVTNIEPLCRLYRITGNRAFLDKAVSLFEESRRMERWTSDETPRGHGVTYCETVKLPVILYMATGETKYLDAARNALRKVDRDHMLVDGIPSSAEPLNGIGSRKTHETCVISDYTWAVGYMLAATGEVEWADKIERACFNAGPGCITKDFRAHQYFSAPNQVLATRTSSHELYARNRMSYRPGHGVQCCTGNVHRFMPNYAARMWMRDRTGGVVAALYGPSEFQALVGEEKQPVTIAQETNYPFDETIRFRIKTDQHVRFPLSMRIPHWCREASVSVNGVRQDLTVRAGTFVTLDKQFAPDEAVILTLPMPLKLTRWPDGGVALERGPLVFSLAVKEKRTALTGEPKSSPEFPAWDMEPAQDWNYAIALDESSLEKNVEIIRSPKAFANPWDYANPPIALKVPAVKVLNWTLEVSEEEDVDRKKKRKFKTEEHQVPETDNQDLKLKEYHYTPELPDPKTMQLADKIEMLTLVPYGATLLRVTVFPQISQ